MENKRSKINCVAGGNNLMNKMNNFAQFKIQQPLLNPLIVQKVLEFLKFNNQDKKVFLSLRLVCKVWDEECSKILRRETEISITKLTELYPDGLGWAEYRPDDISVFEHHYNCPFPTSKEFQNVRFTANCESFKDRNVHRWFSVMGDQVKSLHFICPLACFHQNDYLANILDKWCPNLETLHLDGIQCFSSLIYIFEGRSNRFESNQNCAIKCRKLKNLTISVDSDNDRINCKPETDEILPENPNIQKLRSLMSDFKEMIDMLPNKDPSFRPEINTLFHEHLESTNPKTLSILIAKGIGNYFNVDWGVLGQILKTAPLQKLVVKKLAHARQTQDFVVFLLTQPSKLRYTLRHLEFHCASLSRFCLKALSLLKCSLWTFRVDKIVWRYNAAKHLYDFLDNSAITLTRFEIDIDYIIFVTGNPDSMNLLKIPFLPKLNSFTNKNIGLLHVNGSHILRNAPYLETCYIDYTRSDTNSRNTYKALDKFCANLGHPSIREHALKKLIINVCVGSKHVNLLGKGLANLEKVELEICNVSEFVLGYSRSEGWKKIKALTLYAGVTYVDYKYIVPVGNEDTETDSDSNSESDSDEYTTTNSEEDSDGVCEEDLEGVCDDDIANCFDKLKTLKTFDLTLNRSGNLPAYTFTNGFAKLQQLTSLKISNMLMLCDEKEEIDGSISLVPFTTFSNTIVRPREEFHQWFLRRRTKKPLKQAEKMKVRF